jgi:hypothetical protein
MRRLLRRHNLFQDLARFSPVDSIPWCHELQSAVLVLMVVPVHKLQHPGTGFAQYCKSFVGVIRGYRQVNPPRSKESSLWSQATALLHSVNAPVEPNGVSASVQSSVSKPPSIHQLTANRFGIAPDQARHKLGRSHPTALNQENPLPFFSLLPRYSAHQPTHNRAL